MPIGPILGQILSKPIRFFKTFLKCEQILAQIWENFEKQQQQQQQKALPWRVLARGVGL